TAQRPLRFYGFQVQLDPDGRDRLPVTTQKDVLELLAEWGVPTNPRNHVARDIDDVVAFTEQVDHMREELDYAIDGVVVKVAPLALWPELGVIGERDPRWAIAFKFPADLATTKLLSIE